MGMPAGIKIIDCMLGIPEAEDRSNWFDPFRPLIKDAQTLQQFAMPAQYMFKDIPTYDEIRAHKAAIDFVRECAMNKKKVPLSTDLLLRLQEPEALVFLHQGVDPQQGKAVPAALTHRDRLLHVLIHLVGAGDHDELARLCLEEAQPELLLVF